MVTGALGMKSHMTREESTKEREKLKEARGKNSLLLLVIKTILSVLVHFY